MPEPDSPAAPKTFFIETLGCPKNQVDSDKLLGTLVADGMVRADSPDQADLVVVNTCAFVEEARQESIDTILSLDDLRRDGSEIVVTGCMAERYGDELAELLPEIDRVAGFGVALTPPAPAGGGVLVGLSPTRRSTNGDPSAPTVPSMDLLELPRPASASPWAYVKVAEGCDRNCGFCAIPSFRGKQRSRSIDSILAEVDQLAAHEIVLVAQDLAAYGRDQGQGERNIIPLVRAVADRVERVRLLYLYPSDLTDALIDTICATGVPYFDLSLQHVSRPLLRRMRRWGDGSIFSERIDAIRAREPDATFRSNFIVGYPGETEDDHDALIEFVEQTRLDWCGFFPYSEESGTYAADLDAKVPAGLAQERLAELVELQDRITAERRRPDRRDHAGAHRRSG
ncbi:MAG: MiaB/RimO family radical SAM methylthiotransferase [Acidimicrobiales bacterium]